MTSKEGILINFGKRLKKIREEKGYSIRELAARADLEYSQVQRIEKGKVNLAYTTLIALSEGLGVEPFKLLQYNT